MNDLDRRLAELSPEKRAVLERLLRERGLTAPTLPIPERQRGREALPLSFGQQRLWFLNRLEPGSPIYNVHAAMAIAPGIVPDVVRRAIGEIVRRHEVLRTTFSEVAGRPVPVVAPELMVPLPVADLTPLAAVERERAFTALAHDHAHRPFDLERGPLLRTHLLRLGDEPDVLLVTMHHIVTDGWSMDIFKSELEVLCSAFAAGGPSPLHQLTIQYADFAAWQRDWLQGAVLEEQLGYWKRKLAGAPALLDLPTDHPRPPSPSPEGAFQVVTLAPAASERLKALSKRESATLFMVLLSAFKLLLHRYTGQHDIVVGSPVAGRTRAEVEGLIGFFINTLALRTDLSGDPTFSELLGRVRVTTTEALARQDVPFERLVAELAPERSLSRAPLFQVMVQLLNVGALTDDQAEALTEPGEVQRGTSLFDLSVDFSESPEGIRAMAQYSVGLFEDATIARMLIHLRTLLEGIAENPDRRLSELPWLSASERRQLLVEWNATARAYPLELGAHALFEAQVERSPDATALVAAGYSLTYAELNGRANRLAHRLRRLGIGPDVLVVLYMDRSPETVVAMLAVLKAGGAYVPVDPATPAERVQFMLEDTRAPVVMTHARLRARVPGEPRWCLAVDAMEAELGLECEDNPAPEAAPHNLAYVLYTSGSTGRPKGVMISRRSLTNFVGAARDVYNLQAGDRVLQFASIAFDIAVEEIFPTLAAGAMLVLRGAEELESVAALLRHVEGAGVTILDLPTAYWHELVRQLFAGAVRLPGCVHTVIAGGERMLPERVHEWDVAVGDAVRLMQGYGPTEVTVVATVADLTRRRGGRERTREVPIGAPIGNARVYVLDDYQQPVPVGVPGEAWIGGEGLARGYLNLPELTAECFLPDPFRPGTDERLYRTGDRVSLLPTGELIFHSRRDHQVKIRGFRVEPGEVDAVLSAHESVRESAVVAEAGPAGDMRLVAYVVPAEGTELDRPALRRFLEERLPSYMIPATIVALAALPLTVTGKLDRQRLSAPDLGEGLDGSAFRPPLSVVERALAAIWSSVLGVSQVGLDDGFFDLGGHSLLATQVVFRVREQLGVEVALRMLFEHPRLEDLARAVEAARGDDPALIGRPLIHLPRERYRARRHADGMLELSPALRAELAGLAGEG
jgi:amino acid adenylation domain-containing protein